MISSFEEQKNSSSILGPFLSPKTTILPFRPDFLDVNFVSRKVTDLYEEMVLLASSKDGRSCMSFFSLLDDTKGKKIDKSLENSPEQHCFQLFPHGLSHQLVKSGEMIGASSGLVRDDISLINYNLLLKKEKVHHRHIKLLSSIFRWNAYLKNHIEMISLAFDPIFLWSDSYIGITLRGIAQTWAPH